MDVAYTINHVQCVRCAHTDGCISLSLSLQTTVIDLQILSNATNFTNNTGQIAPEHSYTYSAT